MIGRSVPYRQLRQGSREHAQDANNSEAAEAVLTERRSGLVGRAGETPQDLRLAFGEGGHQGGQPVQARTPCGKSLVVAGLPLCQVVGFGVQSGNFGGEACDGAGDGVQGLALFDLGLPQGGEDLAGGAIDGANLGDVPVGQRGDRASGGAVLP
jgi:hypothetical protein